MMKTHNQALLIMDRFRSMETFVAAVEAGSFTAAGEQLGVSQQQVAKSVAQLEQHLGAKLLNRTTRRQSLTMFGEQYLVRCRQILGAVQEAERLSQELDQVPRGKLKISAPKTFGTYSLMPFITAFMARYPEIELELVMTDHTVDLNEAGYEAAFRFGELPNSSLIARPLPLYRLVACAAPSYLARQGTPTHPEQLIHHECLSYLLTNASACQMWHFYQPGQPGLKIPITSRLNINESTALLAATLRGAGIAMAPEVMVSDALADGRLVRLFPDFEGPARPVHLLYTQDKYRTAKLRTFIEDVLAYYQSLPG